MRGTELQKSVQFSPNTEPRFNGKRPDMLLLHYTGMDDAQSACSWLCSSDSKVSCHYLIDENGLITQMVDEDLRAWHAGVSSWGGDIDINSASIGIEVHNPGHSGGYPEFPETQIESVIALSKDIIVRHGIRPSRVLAHSDVAPARKIDPGEKFPWQALHENGVGHWVAPELITGGAFLQLGDSGESVQALQAMLRMYGYGIEEAGVFDKSTELVVRAFQRHFRAQRVDGVADVSTIMTLRALLGSPAV